MLIGTVAQHQVDQHLEPQLVGAVDQRVEIPKRAEHRVHVAVIGHVIAEIQHRRAEERRDPDRINTQIGHVIQPVDDPGQIADPVAVAVLETARVDLVDHRAAPPVPIRRHDGFGRDILHQVHVVFSLLSGYLTDPANRPRTR